MPCPFRIFIQSGYFIQIVHIYIYIYIYILNGKQCRSRSVGFFRSQLIWIYTVCKCRIYLGLAGLGLIVCVEVLRPSQPNGVMSSAVSLPNHTFTGQALSSKRLTSIVHILSPETDNCPSWISGRERMTVENISWSISTKECCRPRRGRTRDLLVSSRTAHRTEPLRPAGLGLNAAQMSLKSECLAWINHYGL